MRTWKLTMGLTLGLCLVATVASAQVWTFDADAEGWDDLDDLGLGGDRDIDVTWDASGKLLLTYFDNGNAADNLAWPATGVMYSFEAADNPNVTINYEALNTTIRNMTLWDGLGDARSRADVHLHRHRE